MMSQPKQAKEKKSKAPPMVNNNVGQNKNAAVQKVAKEAKQEIKADNSKPSEKNLAKPTAEQMSIAQIIYPHSDDSSLNDKLKQVMDATQRSVDEAFTALHDSDNDPNRAVNLLLEGGNKSDEWSTSSKKKKTKSPNEKKETNSTDPPTASESEDWSAAVNPQPNRVNKNPETNRGTGRGRTFPRRGRGRGGSNTEIEKERVPPKKGRPELNGPSSRSGGRSFRGGRGGGRGSGGRQPFRRTFDTWNQDSQSQPANNVFNQSVDDWVEEEYTGSLANSQVFTPSAQSEPTALHGPSPNNNSFPIIQDEEESNERLQERIHVTTAEIMSHFSLQQRPLQSSPPSLNQNIGISDSIMLENKAVPHSLPGEPTNSISPVSGLMISESDYIYPNVARGRNIGLMGYPQQSDDVRIQRITPSKPKPRIPPPSKIPSSAVEMPPDADSAIGLLDVQFGALEFGENSSEPVHNSPPSSRQSTPSPQPAETIVTPTYIPSSESIPNNDSRSFSPTPGTVANPLTSQIAASEPAKIPDTTSSSLYQDNVYHSSSLYTKSAQHQSMYNHEFSPSNHSQRQSGQIITSNNIIPSTSSTTLSTYASSSTGTYGNSSYPNYQYPNFPTMSSLPTTQPPTSSSTNSYQVSASAQQFSTTNNNTPSVYGSSGLGASTYSSGYQGYNHQLNHKSLASNTPNSKEYESSTPPVNMNSIAHSSSMSGGGNTLLSSTPSSSVSKPSSASSMAKGPVVASMPPGVTGLVGTHQYIVGQGSVPYFQQPHMYYEDLQLMPQQRLPHHIAATGYYEMGYQPTTTREGVQQYNMSDGRFARADNTSPVQVSSMNQPSGTQTHQQPLINPTAMPQGYAYFYGGSTIMPGNFPFGAPATLYPVAATGSSTGHGNSSSGVYGKPSNYTGNYTGMYDSSQSNVGEYKSTTTPGNKSQSTTAVNPSTASDIQMMYSKSHSALSKVGSYEKTSFHCPTPPPFNLGSQNSGIAPAGGYAPQHLFIPTINPHHNTTLMHQPIHQESTNTVNSRSSMNNNPNKNSTKSNYSSSNYWAQN